VIDATHDPNLRSWVESANRSDTDFPIQNLPFGRWRERGSTGPWRAAIAIGDELLDLSGAGFIPSPDIRDVLQLSASARQTLRHALSAALRQGSAEQAALAPHLRAMSDVELGLPCDTRDYTDFYSGIHHAVTVGSLFRPDNPLLPNYKWVPIGYHGRASSLVPSGTAFHRPLGQVKPPHVDEPMLAPTRRLDYELELGIVIGPGNALGQRVAIDDAEAHVVGITLLNDWSARDIQGWEYQPLGPFLAKNFATTLSPWIVTLEALAPYRAAFTRPVGDPEPLPYLESIQNRREGALDIRLCVALTTPRMRADQLGDVIISQSNSQDAYWTIGQLVAHHTVNGCNLSPGDLLGTGTLSGPAPEQGGSLLELSHGGKKPLQLPNGETRTFLEDGDEVVLRARCERDGFRGIGFGECRGRVLASQP
jgi:fumarylacetoacetase